MTRTSAEYRFVFSPKIVTSMEQDSLWFFTYNNILLYRNIVMTFSLSYRNSSLKTMDKEEKEKIIKNILANLKITISNGPDYSDEVFPVKPTIAAQPFGSYSAAAGNIASGWYEKDNSDSYGKERDKLRALWTHEHDDILRKYLLKYGAFFNAWQDEIAQDIEQISGFNPISVCRHFAYYISSRICTKPELLQLWEKSLKEYGDKEYTCRICNKSFRLVDAHPRLIHEHGLTLDICRNCNYVERRYKKRNPESLPLVPKIMKEIDKTRICICCGKQYNLERYTFVYSPNWAQNIDLLFVNLYADTCFSCFSNACLGRPKGNKSESLQALRKYADFLEHVPNRDPAYELKNLRDKNEMGTLIKLLQNVRPSHWYASEYGSYFEALIAAHVLPDGTQRMARGTRVLAVDGDLCFSMKEKAIDDFLFKLKIAHVKEALYPDSKMRADWEVYHNSQRFFIEYFGLMNNPEYAEKAKRKKEICKQNDIQLVEIYPNTDFERALTLIFRKKHNNGHPL